MRFIEVIFCEFGAADPGDIQVISGALWEFVYGLPCLPEALGYVPRTV